LFLRIFSFVWFFFVVFYIFFGIEVLGVI
jgi:hypothetical protein